MFVAMQFVDGYLDAAIIKDCPRWDVLGLVFQMKDAAYMNSPCVEYFKVRLVHVHAFYSTHPVPELCHQNITRCAGQL